MKRTLAVLAIGMLAACGSNETAEAPAEDTAVAETADTGSNAAPGTYEVTMADGSMMTATLAEDGTYTDTVDGEVTETGVWAIVGEKTCFTPAEGSEGTPMCYSDSPMGEDGTFTATPDEGDPITVRKVS
jgi:hypothetical protein